MKIQYAVLATRYGSAKDDISHLVSIHELSVSRLCFWKIRESISWWVCGKTQRFPRFHSWWVEHMELTATMALEIENRLLTMDLTKQQYEKLHM